MCCTLLHASPSLLLHASRGSQARCPFASQVGVTSLLLGPNAHGTLKLTPSQLCVRFTVPFATLASPSGPLKVLGRLTTSSITVALTWPHQPRCRGFSRAPKTCVLVIPGLLPPAPRIIVACTVWLKVGRLFRRHWCTPLSFALLSPTSAQLHLCILPWPPTTSTYLFCIVTFGLGLK